MKCLLPISVYLSGKDFRGGEVVVVFTTFGFRLQVPLEVSIGLNIEVGQKKWKCLGTLEGKEGPHSGVWLKRPSG